jgi:NAD(P)-dependent dehydrogenase (short-subunit alcohol dehydrogenase family)
VLITGVSRGLGRALALELARRGHAVVGCGRSAEHLRSLEAEITSPSRHFLTVADVVRLRSSSDRNFASQLLRCFLGSDLLT